MFLSDNILQASRPAHVKGTLTATLSAILLSAKPSAIIPSASTAVTSALTGPEIILHISAITSLKFFPDLAIMEGFVVTPSTIPDFVNWPIASVSALSIKNFITIPLNNRYLIPYFYINTI